MTFSEKELNTILTDMQTEYDNYNEYLKFKTENGDRQSDYHRAYLFGMIRIMNILGYIVKVNVGNKISICKEDEA